MADGILSLRKFGFCVVDWKIKNYFAATCTEKWVIKSPVFTVNGKNNTRWRLYLKENYTDESHIVCAYLAKVKCDSRQEPFWVTWKCVFPCESGSTFFEIESDFEKRKSVGKRLCRPYEFDCIMQSTEEDTLVIRSMIFVSPKDSQTQERSKDSGLKSLSQDLTVLYRINKINNDLEINIGGFVAKPHKAILCSRNSVLKTAIETEDCDTVFKETNGNAAKNIFAYLYSGNLDYVVRKPTFEMQQCIKLLAITELEKYYEPDELELCSEFQIEVCRFYYNIAVDSDAIVCYSSIHNDSSSSNHDVSLHFYPTSLNGKSRYISILIENTKGNFSDISYVELVVLDSNGNSKHFKRKRCYGYHQEIFFKNFVPRDVLKDITTIHDGNFHLLCSIFTPISDSKMSSTVKKEVHPNIVIDPERHYNILSDQMCTLFETGIYSDLTLTCNGEEFRVHSYILTARSYVFKHLYDKSKAMGLKNIWDISSMKSNVLKALLYFIYCGKLLSLKIGEILQLYEAADRFCVLSLKHTCSSMLQNNVQSLDAKSVLNVAKTFKDYKLAASLEKFISSKSSKCVKNAAYTLK